MGKKLTTEEFIVRAKAVHGDRYDYSQTAYESGKVKVSILCPTHNQVFLQRPVSHLQGQGCGTCGRETTIASRTLSKESFLVRAYKVHEGFYTYPDNLNYTTAAEKVVIVCPLHGEFRQTAKSHLRGRGCPVCWEGRRGVSRTIGWQDLVKRATEKHEGAYEYPDQPYKNTSHHIIIKCALHGEFSQLATNHLHGYGCSKCTKKGHYSISRITENKKEYKGHKNNIYLMHLPSMGVDVYKIGMAKDVRSRKSEVKGGSGHTPVISLTYATNTYDAFMLEKYFHDLFSKLSYESPVRFAGHTELFELSPSHIKFIKEFLEDCKEVV